jgi:hypothetical protein
MARKKLIARYGTSWRICLRNFALDVARFCRMALSGNGLATILESATRSAVIISPSLSNTGLVDFSTDVQIASAIFLAYTGSSARLRAWHAAVLIMAANLMRGFVCGTFLVAGVYDRLLFAIQTRRYRHLRYS